MRIKCINCGGNNVIAEAKAIVRFKINKAGDIEIISDWSDIIEQINNKVVLNCECEDCSEHFVNYRRSGIK